MRFFLALLLAFAGPLLPAAEFRYQTENFCVWADSPEKAREVAVTAEVARADLARRWFGRLFPKWNEPCQLRVIPGAKGSGETSYVLYRGEVYGYTSWVCGRREEVLRNVIPHEVMHMLSIEQCRRPFPRLIDEALAFLSEADVPAIMNHRDCGRLVREGRFMSLRKIASMEEYPDAREAFYAEVGSLLAFLLNLGGREVLTSFVRDLAKDPSPAGWKAALALHYDCPSLAALENAWLFTVMGETEGQ